MYFLSLVESKELGKGVTHDHLRLSCFIEPNLIQARRALSQVAQMPKGREELSAEKQSCYLYTEQIRCLMSGQWLVMVISDKGSGA